MQRRMKNYDRSTTGIKNVHLWMLVITKSRAELFYTALHFHKSSRFKAPPVLKGTLQWSQIGFLKACCCGTQNQTSRKRRRGGWTLTILCVFMLSVRQSQVGVGSAGQTWAAARLGVSSAPQTDCVLWGHDSFCLGVCIRAYAEWVVTVWHCHVWAVCHHARSHRFTKGQISQRKICTWKANSR